MAQVYVSEVSPKVERPEHELKGFERVNLKPGETKHISIRLDERAFSYFDTHLNGWSIGSDRFIVSVGDCVGVLPLKAELNMNHTAK